jgi:hypothetical protein
MELVERLRTGAVEPGARLWAAAGEEAGGGEGIVPIGLELDRHPGRVLAHHRAAKLHPPITREASHDERLADRYAEPEHAQAAEISSATA